MRSKEQERRFVEILRDCSSSFPSGELLESESPDFIIVASHGKIGVEVTKIHQTTTLHQSRQQESERRAVVNEALQNYKTKSSIPLEVKIHFGCNVKFNKRNRNRFAATLANLVISTTPAPDSWSILQNNWENPAAFPYEVESISIIRLSALNRNFWSDPSAGFIQEDFVPEMEVILAKKEQLIGGYRSDCIAHWLLIVGEGNSASTFFDPSAATIRHVYNSSFARVFFLEAFKRKIWELTVSKG